MAWQSYKWRREEGTVALAPTGFSLPAEEHSAGHSCLMESRTEVAKVERGVSPTDSTATVSASPDLGERKLLPH